MAVGSTCPDSSSQSPVTCFLFPEHLKSSPHFLELSLILFRCSSKSEAGSVTHMVFLARDQRASTMLVSLRDLCFCDGA